MARENPNVRNFPQKPNLARSLCNGVAFEPLTSIFGMHSQRHIEDRIQLFESLFLSLRQEEQDLGVSQVSHTVVRYQ